MQEINDQIKFTISQCACGYKTASAAGIVSFKTRHNELLIIKQCVICKTLYAPLYPDDSSLDLYYQNFYRKIKHKNESPAELFKRQEIRSNNLNRIYNPRESDRIVDFGGASGGLVFRFLNKAESVGVYDLDKNFTDYAKEKGINVFNDLNSLMNSKPNLIIMSHVIEHLKDPGYFIKNFKKLGVTNIYISTTFIEDSLRVNNKFSFSNDIHLAHKFYFTRLSLNRLLNKYGYKAKNYSQDWVQYVLESGENRSPPFISQLYERVPVKFIIKINFGVPLMLRRFLRYLESKGKRLDA